MRTFVDIHCHALFGVDDGARNESVMEKMLRMAYCDGTRVMCLTPHHDVKGTASLEQIKEVFAEAEAFCRDNLPDMRVYLGNELTYRFGCAESLIQGSCKTLAESRYVLVDFFSAPDAPAVIRGVESLQNAGFLPIVAHVERYGCFSGNKRELIKLSQTGAVLQINAASLLQGWFSSIGRTARWLLAKGMAHVVASDGHDDEVRVPVLGKAYDFVKKRFGEAYAEQLFCVHPMKILEGKRIDKNW